MKLQGTDKYRKQVLLRIFRDIVIFQVIASEKSNRFS